MTLEERLTTRAKRHRFTATLYTIAVFLTIFSALGAYYYFNNLELDILQEKNAELNQELKIQVDSARQAISKLEVNVREKSSEINNKLEDLDEIFEANQTFQTQIDYNINRLTSEIDSAGTFSLDGEIRAIQRHQDTVRSFLERSASELRVRLSSAYPDSLDRWYRYVYPISEVYRNARQLSEKIERINVKVDSLNNVLEVDSLKKGTLKRFLYYTFKKKKARIGDELDAVTEPLKQLDQEIMDTQIELSRLINQDTTFVRTIQSQANLVERNAQNIQNKTYQLWLPLDENSRKVYKQLNRNESLASDIQRTYLVIQNDVSGNRLQYFKAEELLANIDGLINDIYNDLAQVTSWQDTFFRKLDERDSLSKNVYSLPETLARYGLIAFLIYIIQILLSYSKYHYRLAGFYDSKADVISLKNDLSDIETEKLIKLLDSSGIGVGRVDSIFQKGFETAKEVIQKSK